MKRSKQILLLSLLMIVTTQAVADLIFSAPPRGTEAKERAIYEPLASAMSEWLGTKVVYEYPRDFMTYSVHMRKGYYDILFDGPHFASWRVANINHQYLANLPDKLVFLVVTPASNSNITNTDSLVANKVCVQPPPYLGTLILMSQYNDPAREPIMQISTGEANVYKALKLKSCVAAILLDRTFYKLNEAERSKYKIIYSSRPVPNNVLTAGPKVSAEQRLILIKNLTDQKTAVVAKPIFASFSNNATSFEASDPQKFQGLDLLLKEFSYGW